MKHSLGKGFYSDLIVCLIFKQAYTRIMMEMVIAADVVYAQAASLTNNPTMMRRT